MFILICKAGPVLHFTTRIMTLCEQNFAQCHYFYTKSYIFVINIAKKDTFCYLRHGDFPKTDL